MAVIARPQISVAPNFLSSGTTSAPLFPTVGGTGTTTKIFPLINNSTVAIALPVPGNGELEGTIFSLRIGGEIKTGSTASPTLNFVAQSGTSLTSSSNITFATLNGTFSAAASTSYPFGLELDMIGGSVSGDCDVVSAAFNIGPNYFELNANGRSDTNYVKPTQLTGLSFSTTLGTDNVPASNAPVFNIVFGITFGVSDSANLAYLKQMTLSVL